MNYIWLVSSKKIYNMMFSSLDLVKSSVALSYSNWTVQPTIEIERNDYIAFRAADNTLIEAFRKPVYNQVEHL